MKHTHPTYGTGELILVGDAVGWITDKADHVEVSEVGQVTAVGSNVVVVGGTDRCRPDQLILLARAGQPESKEGSERQR